MSTNILSLPANVMSEPADVTDLYITCLWAMLGLALTGLVFALGSGADIGQILSLAG